MGKKKNMYSNFERAYFDPAANGYEGFPTSHLFFLDHCFATFAINHTNR